PLHSRGSGAKPSPLTRSAAGTRHRAVSVRVRSASRPVTLTTAAAKRAACFLSWNCIRILLLPFLPTRTVPPRGEAARFPYGSDEGKPLSDKVLWLYAAGSPARIMHHVPEWRPRCARF